MVRNPFLFIILKKGIKLSLSKNFSSETSERYALALFETAKDSSEIEITEKSVREILELYNECEDLKNFIKDPTQSQNTQLLQIKHYAWVSLNLLIFYCLQN